MSVAVANNWQEIIAHLPAGSCLRLEGVPWAEYEEILHDLGPSYSVRIFYDRGKLEIMPPIYDHEAPISGIHSLIIVLRDELDIDVQPIGSTTLRLRRKEAGAEPDDGFYIQHAAALIGKRTLDLSQDPPPDIVVEVDRTSISLDKFPIYARIGVPEIWCLYGETVRFHLLTGGVYQGSQTSLAFPFLTAGVVSHFLAQSLQEGERRAARAFRDWLREHLNR